MTDFITDNPPIEAPIHGSTGGATTFTDVEDRLVEAMLTCWRYPDRERGWQRLRSAWPEITRDAFAGDYDARGGDGASATLRAASQTRREIAEMDEAFSWLDAIVPDDRKLVGLVIVQLARGQREVSWLKLLGRMGLERGADGLRKRYGRAITSICAAQTRRNPSSSASSG